MPLTNILMPLTSILTPLTNILMPLTNILMLDIFMPNLLSNRIGQFILNGFILFQTLLNCFHLFSCL